MESLSTGMKETEELDLSSYFLNRPRTLCNDRKKNGEEEVEGKGGVS